MILRSLGDNAGARAAFERGLKIMREHYPKDHPLIRKTRGYLESLEN
jgi:hypothetical protein